MYMPGKYNAWSGVGMSLALARSIALTRGGKCLSESYFSVNTKMDWECQYGHQWAAKLNHVKDSSSWCPTCAGKLNNSIELARQIAIERGGVCLSRTYKNLSTPMEWQCMYGHRWSARFSHIKHHSSWCPKCAGHGKTIEDLQAVAIEWGGNCLGTRYINGTTPVLWECARGHKWEARPNNVVNNGTWCPQCRGCQKLSLDDARQAAAGHNGECLSLEYVNVMTPLLWRCAHGHEWAANLNNIRSKGCWCPSCHLKNESQVREIFERLTGRQFRKTKGLFRTNPLWELDGYCPGIEIAFEYHGEQHFDIHPHFHRKGLEDFEKQLSRDRDVEKLVLQRKTPITLIIIPFTLAAEVRENFIRNELDNLGVLR